VIPAIFANGRMERVKYVYSLVQPMALGMSFKSQPPSSLFNGTWQKRLRELDYRLRFEIEEMTLGGIWADILIQGGGIFAK